MQTVETIHVKMGERFRKQDLGGMWSPTPGPGTTLAGTNGVQTTFQLILDLLSNDLAKQLPIQCLNTLTDEELTS